MAKSDLLKEAIADAKAVKETAIANAKIALQEAFTPRISRMISDQIENELDSEEDLPTGDEPIGDEMDDKMGDEGEEGVNWIDNDLSFSVGGTEYDAEVSNPAEEEPIGDEMGAEFGNEEEPIGDEFGNDEEEPIGDEMEEELNLEAIIRELEGDLELDEAELTEEAEVNFDALAATLGVDPREAERMYDAFQSMKKMEKAEDETLEEGEDEDLSIDEIIESILREEEMGMEADVPANTDGEELAEAKAELEEAYNTVKQLKSIISEVNLLNAKLLYTNKLFRNFELSEGQKMKVIENFDRAGNTREVKLVFSTLAESFKRPTKTRIVKESAASKPVATTAPTAKTTQVLSEGFEMADRWKKLAGLL
jgi:hypothetical protein